MPRFVDARLTNVPVGVDQPYTIGRTKYGRRTLLVTQVASDAPEFDFIRFLSDYGRLNAFRQPDLGEQHAVKKSTAISMS